MSVMLGIDVGGTKIASALIERRGGLEEKVLSQPTATEDIEAFLQSLYRVIEEAREQAIRENHRIVGIGLGCAGTIDRGERRVVVSPNLPLDDVPLADVVERHTGLPVILDNDANVAALAEVRAGAAAGLSHVLMLTLGTGVGGGMVLDGELYHGATGSAAELGHMVVQADGEPCPCGGRGCLESYASGRALERIAGRLGAERGGELGRLAAQGRLVGEAVGLLAVEGHADAQEAVTEVGRWLGVGVAGLVNIFNPEAVVVGGGLSELGPLVLEPARRQVAELGLRPSRDLVRLVSAVLGGDAGVRGAGIAAWEELTFRPDGNRRGADRS